MSDMSPAEVIFFAALELPPEKRGAYLDTACAGDAELRARIEKMLFAQPHLGTFLDQPAVAPGEAAAVHTSAEDAPPLGLTRDYQGAIEAGTVIAGRYTLVEKIGEGGMGEVWVAKQTEPVKRKVALKLIKAGMDSRQVL